MPGLPALRRSLAALRPSPLVVVPALFGVSLAVLICTGLWASRLGDPPAWAFDCNGTTCTDLWIDARRHYLGITAAAGFVATAGWFLGGYLVPSRSVPVRTSRPSRATRCGHLIGVLLLAAALLTGAGWLTIAASRPLGLAAAGIAAAVAVLGAWRWMRPGAASDRGAYWMASVGVGAPLSVLGLLALHPAVFLVTVLVMGTPLLGIPVLCVLLAIGIALAGRLLPRHAAGGKTVRTAGDSDSEQSPMRALPAASGLSTALAVAVILTLGVLAAWPVDAPAADAWKDSAPDTSAGPGVGSEGEAADGAGSGTGGSDSGGAGVTSETSPAADGLATPPVDAAGLPACEPELLLVTAGGWDWWTGNSAATLTATNVGDTSCALRGIPDVTLEQGGRAIALRTEPLTHLEAAEQPEGGVGLLPGSSAVSRLYWPGYRTAADQETPQTLTLRLAARGETLPVRFTDSVGVDPGVAPFDLRAGVPGGAVIEIGPWEVPAAPVG